MNDDQSTRVQLPDGATTSMRWDDVETGNGIKGGEAPKLITGEKLDEHLHNMPENWLRARVRLWMDGAWVQDPTGKWVQVAGESTNKDWWIGTYSSDGKWIWASRNNDSYVPLMHRIDYARRVCRFINRECAHGGAWLAGWIRGGGEFYLLWKDPQGDIAIQIECGKPFTVIQSWTPDDWAEHAEQAYAVREEFLRSIELAPGQTKNLAQGERVTPGHHDIGDAVAGLN